MGQLQCKNFHLPKFENKKFTIDSDERLGHLGGVITN